MTESELKGGNISRQNYTHRAGTSGRAGRALALPLL